MEPDKLYYASIPNQENTFHIALGSEIDPKNYINYKLVNQSKFWSCNSNTYKCSIKRNSKSEIVYKSEKVCKLNCNKIPKIIWGLWADFDKMRDGVLSDRLLYFKNRIEKMHKDDGWNINIITKWDDIMNIVSNYSWVTKVLSNPFIGGAHKSDILRYIILLQHGGVWLDISSFIIKPLTELITDLDSKDIGFCCMADKNLSYFFLRETSEMYDRMSIKDMKMEGKKYLTLKPHNKDADPFLPVIPENYFIVCRSNHSIVNSIIIELRRMWSSVLTTKQMKQFLKDHQIVGNLCKEKYVERDGKSLVCLLLNKYMATMINTYFVIESDPLKDLFKKYSNHYINAKGDIKYLNLSIDYNSGIANEDFKNMFNCSYLFNYLQIYQSVYNYMKTVGERKIEYVERKFIDDIQNIEHYKDICSDRDCLDVLVNLDNKSFQYEGNVYFISSSYYRLIKWANNMEDRVTFDNTWLRKVLDGAGKEQDAKEKMAELQKAGIYYVKFSGWTRDKAKIIPEIFMKHYQ